MTSWVFFVCCVLLCLTEFTLADGDDAKCTKVEGRADLQETILRKKLVCNYDKLTAPVNATGDKRVAIRTMMMRYRVKYKHSDEWTSVRSARMSEDSPNWFTVMTYVFMSWSDPRLKWNANEYNNRTRAYFVSDEIWVPQVNIAGTEKAVVYVENSGSVHYFFWTHLIGNCWPVHFDWGDRRECVLSFQADPADQVQLIRWKDEFDFLMSNTGTWSIVEAKRVFPLKQGEKNEEFEKIHKEKSWKYGPGYFETKFVIQRNFAVQDAAVFSPAAILVILLISSTWIPAVNASRVAMLSLIVVVQVFMFHQANRAMPFLESKLADIVRLYEELIICTGAAVVEWLIAYNIATQRAPLAESLMMPKPSIFTLLKSVFVISEKGSRHMEIAALLDRISFLVLAVLSFILVVVSKRPPMIVLNKEDAHPV